MILSSRAQSGHPALAPSKNFRLIWAQQAAGLAAGSVLVAGLLDLKILTDGFLTHGRWHAHGVILFESTTPLGAFPEFRSGVIIYESMRGPA